jgi:cell division protein FtsW (lipid II flippase)
MIFIGLLFTIGFILVSRESVYMQEDIDGKGDKVAFTVGIVFIIVSIFVIIYAIFKNNIDRLFKS